MMDKKRLLILDISDGIVAGLRCVGEKRTFSAQAAHHCAITDDSGDSAGRGVQDAVAEVVERCTGSGARCLLSLSATEFSFINLNLPFSDPGKIGEILPYELQDRLGSAAEPFVYDFTSLVLDGGSTELLVAVLGRQRYQGWLELLGSHGLDPEIVTISGMARLQQLCSSSSLSVEPMECFVYLELGRTEATFFYVEDHRIKTIRSLDRIIASLSNGSTQSPLQHLSREVRRTLLALGVDQEESDLPVVIGGAGGADAWLDIERHFNQSSLLFGDVFSLQQILPLEHALHQATGVVPESCLQKLSGLLQADLRSAIRSRQVIDLKRAETAVTGARNVFSQLVRVCGVLLLMLLALGIYQGYDYRKLAKERDGLKDQVNSIFMATLDGAEPVSDPLQELRARIDEMQRTMVFDAVHNPDITAVALLSDISRRIPPAVDVSFERFTFDRQQVTVDGTADTFNDVDKISGRLEESAYYSSVRIGSAVQSTDGSGVLFSLNLQL
ncbi:MAG: PilN domain-containing protein [Desulfocapsaceae bacterium]